MDKGQNKNSSPDLTADIQNDLVPELKNISARESKFSSLTLLIITIILFFSTQIISAKWQEILILIGVLLFHELGHLIAMKLLKYNDVKMFFIPFLGAAVSGKSRNDTAVKSCVVSLMGPLPGIIMGVFLYFMFVLTKNYFVFKTAQVMLVLNAFNFLPIMPLDGGRFIDVLFVNRRYFRFTLAFIGAAIFLILATSTKDIIMGIFGFIAMYAAVNKFKLHGISNHLKSRGIKAASLNELLADESAMQTVVNALQAGYPKHFKPKVIYQAIFNQLTVIVDTIRFVPAKLVSKIMLLITYLGLVTASLIAAVACIALNYQEKARVVEVDGKKTVYAERYLFGQKDNECPINDACYYDGKGTVFKTGPDRASGVFYYADGYRTGEWLTYNAAGETVEKRTYAKGQLVSISSLENGAWKTNSYEDLSFLRKCSEEIQRLSQPYKSIHNYF